MVVPQVSREPLFLDRSGVFRRSGREEMSYVCVPIRVEHRTVGALGVALPYQKDRNYDQEAKFFGVVGSMIGPGACGCTTSWRRSESASSTRTPSCGAS